MLRYAKGNKMKLFETHIQYNPRGDFFAIRSRTLDGKHTEYIYRPLDWLQKYCEKDIPYNWDVIKAHPDQWFLL